MGVDLQYLDPNFLGFWKTQKSKAYLKGPTLLLDNENIYLKGLIVYIYD